jgi:hypothetical protein
VSATRLCDWSTTTTISADGAANCRGSTTSHGSRSPTEETLPVFKKARVMSLSTVGLIQFHPYEKWGINKNVGRTRVVTSDSIVSWLTSQHLYAESGVLSPASRSSSTTHRGGALRRNHRRPLLSHENAVNEAAWLRFLSSPGSLRRGIEPSFATTATSVFLCVTEKPLRIHAIDTR